jgi:hypothetical protein
VVIGLRVVPTRATHSTTRAEHGEELALANVRSRAMLQRLNAMTEKLATLAGVGCPSAVDGGRSGDPRGGRARRSGYRARWRDNATTFAEKVGETALEQLIAQRSTSCGSPLPHTKRKKLEGRASSVRDLVLAANVAVGRATCDSILDHVFPDCPAWLFEHLAQAVQAIARANRQITDELPKTKCHACCSHRKHLRTAFRCNRHRSIRKAPRSMSATKPAVVGAP